MHERLPIGTHPLRERVEITDALKAVAACSESTTG
jgi:hypothetical protein